MRYSETVYLDCTYNWFEYLNNPTLTVKVSMDDAEEMSASWESCAVGQLDVGIERVDGGAPIDNALENLGIEFHNIIRSMNRETDQYYWEHLRIKALSTLRQINSLSFQILWNSDRFKNNG